MAEVSPEEFSDVEMYSTPQTDDFMNWVAAKIPAEWKKFGIICKISLNVLNGIYSNPTHGGEPVMMFCETFKIWQNSPHPEAPFNWRTILNALVSSCISQVALANAIALKLKKRLTAKRNLALSQADDMIQEQNDDDSDISSMESGYYTDDDLRKLCGCGQCSINDIITKGCSRPHAMSRFPILDVTKLSSAKRQQYLYTIEKEAEEIYDAFAALSRKICQSMKDRVSVQEVINFLKISRRITTDAKSKSMLSLKLESAQDMDKVFSVVADICSWFNHHPLGSLVKEFGSAKDKKLYKDFINKELMPYLQRSITEIPKDAFGPEIEGSGHFRLKLDDITEHETITGTKLNFLNGKVAEALDIPMDCLHLLSITEGCIELEYSVPLTLYEKIFSPLSYEHSQALASIFIDRANNIWLGLKSVWYGQYYEVSSKIHELEFFHDKMMSSQRGPLHEEIEKLQQHLQVQNADVNIVHDKKDKAILEKDQQIQEKIKKEFILNHQLQASISLLHETQLANEALKKQYEQLQRELEEIKTLMTKVMKQKEGTVIADTDCEDAIKMKQEESELVHLLKNKLDQEKEEEKTIREQLIQEIHKLQQQVDERNKTIQDKDALLHETQQAKEEQYEQLQRELKEERTLIAKIMKQRGGGEITKVNEIGIQCELVGTSFKADIAHQVICTSYELIKESIGFLSLAEKLLENQVINDREKTHLTEYSGESRKNERMDKLLDILALSIKEDGDDFKLFLDILKQENTRRAKRLVDKLLEKYRMLIRL